MEPKQLVLLPLFFAAGWLACFAANWLALVPWRRSLNAHWTERARLLWPVRISARLNILLLPASICIIAFLVWPRRGWLILMVAIASLPGAILGTFPFDREVFPLLRFRGWLRHVCMTVLLGFGFWLVYGIGAASMPQRTGWRTLLVAGIVLMFHLGLQWGLALRLLRWTRLIRPADDRLHRIVEETSAGMGIRVRSVWLLGGISCQAFAFPTTADLLFTQRLLEVCTDDEVSAICAHELGHLGESKATIFGRVAGSLWIFPWVFIRPAMNALGFPALLVLLAATSGLMLFTRALSRRMETRADQVAAENQVAAGVYARALEKLYRENHLPAVNPANLRTHPHLYDRMLTAGLTPDYPRPAPPRKMAPVGWAIWLSFSISLGVLLGRLLADAQK